MAALGKLSLVRYNVKNWEAAKKFWGETIGLPVAWASDEMGWVQYGGDQGAQIAINRARNGQEVGGGDRGTIAIFDVPDVNQAVKVLRTKGVRCDDAVLVPGVVAYAQCYDPDGNAFQIAAEPPKM
jgi:predicted enzyme related to lactoylglutathione lyase